MGTKMFKVGSFEEDLFTGMQKSLVSSQLDNKLSLDKLTKAADYINIAAELLDDTGFLVEADMLTKVLKRLANEQDADANNARHDITEEAAKALESSALAEEPDQVIIEPLEQEIHVAPAVQTPEYKQFEAIAAKIATQSKKKV